MGNAATKLMDPDGKPIVDVAGHEVASGGNPTGRAWSSAATSISRKASASKVETLAWNFRNNYKVAVDSFGTMWQSDNDDDGNKGVRINYVMEYGNYGYTDEMTGASWQTPRTNIETEIPLRHWHQNDPGSIPNLLQTGSGSPTGILVNEGTLLGQRFENQIIHCDAGPRIVRAYPVTNDGAGYKAEMVDILTTTDNWYRPADVAIAPDGSLFVADWYDPGVGGHGMGDHEAGNIRGPHLPRGAEGLASTRCPRRISPRPRGAWPRCNRRIAPRNTSRRARWRPSAARRKRCSAPRKDANPRFRARAMAVSANIPPLAVEAIKAGLNGRRFRPARCRGAP